MSEIDSNEFLLDKLIEPSEDYYDSQEIKEVNSTKIANLIIFPIFLNLNI